MICATVLIINHLSIWGWAISEKKITDLHQGSLNLEIMRQGRKAYTVVYALMSPPLFFVYFFLKPFKSQPISLPFTCLPNIKPPQRPEKVKG